MNKGRPSDHKLLHITNQDGDELIKIEPSRDASNAVPLDFHFLQTQAADDVPTKIETLASTDSIPLNFRF